jgi:hypothetical protein
MSGMSDGIDASYAPPISQIVFPGEPGMEADRWPHISDDGRGRVLLSVSLSNEVAVRAIERQYSMIVTSNGSFACHGANLLRAARRRGVFVGWITNCPIDQWNNAQAYLVGVSPREPCKKFYPPDLLAIALPSGDSGSWRCLWPDRTYDRLSASIMSQGLERNIQRLLNTELSDTPDGTASVHLGVDGLLWHQPTEFSSEFILKLTESSPVFEREIAAQVGLYDEIVDACIDLDLIADPARRLGEVAKWLYRYFEHFLLLHRSYDALLARSGMQLAAILGEAECERTMQLCLVPDAILWQETNKLVLRNRKDLLSGESVLVLPAWLRSSSDLAETRERVRESLEGRSTAAVAYADFAATVAVVKEWKFLVNKLLFTRFGAAVMDVFDSSERANLSRLTIVDLLEVASKRTGQPRPEPDLT